MLTSEKEILHATYYCTLYMLYVPIAYSWSYWHPPGAGDNMMRWGDDILDQSSQSPRSAKRSALQALRAQGYIWGNHLFTTTLIVSLCPRREIRCSKKLPDSETDLTMIS